MEEMRSLGYSCFCQAQGAFRTVFASKLTPYDGLILCGFGDSKTLVSKFGLPAAGEKEGLGGGDTIGDGRVLLIDRCVVDVLEVDGCNETLVACCIFQASSFTTLVLASSD